ncbi:MAG: hypothetical protein HY067_08510 [Betaproteobacteria bacterium]|nr:hypothetical protein [Betaproteobacteria bacterium]
MSKLDIEQILNSTIDAFDFQFMIGDVKDFLEFSESNIDWQHHREFQAIARRKDFDDFPPGYRNHLEQNADHRFKVSLPLRVRYGALLAFTTSVEWAVAYLNRSAFNPVPDKKDGTNHVVRVLREFTARVSVDPQGVIDDYEALVQIRNCVVHSAGVVATYQFKRELPNAIARINGISLGNWHFFGDQICIERGVLERYIDKTASLVVDLHTKMRERGLLI